MKKQKIGFGDLSFVLQLAVVYTLFSFGLFVIGFLHGVFATLLSL